MISPYGQYPAMVALQHAARRQAELEAVSRPAQVEPGRPALRVVEGDLANEAPRLRQPSRERPL